MDFEAWLAWWKQISLKVYVFSVEDKMAAGAFGRAGNYGWDSPLRYNTKPKTIPFFSFQTVPILVEHFALTCSWRQPFSTCQAFPQIVRVLRRKLVDSIFQLIILELTLKATLSPCTCSNSCDVTLSRKVAEQTPNKLDNPLFLFRPSKRQYLQNLVRKIRLNLTLLRR